MSRLSSPTWGSLPPTPTLRTPHPPVDTGANLAVSHLAGEALRRHLECIWVFWAVCHNFQGLCWSLVCRSRQNLGWTCQWCTVPPKCQLGPPEEHKPASISSWCIFLGSGNEAGPGQTAHPSQASNVSSRPPSFHLIIIN